MDALDNLLLNSQPINSNLAELKPLPPFTGYTGHLSINGIQGHHYHALSQRIPEENNNNSYSSYNEQNSLVTSSTCSASAADSDTKPGFNVGDVKINFQDCANPDTIVNPDSVSGSKIFDECGNSSGAETVTHIKTEIAEYDISSIEDIAAIIGSAIADTTVPSSNNQDGDDPSGSRDSWMDLDAWIDGACSDPQRGLIITTQDGLSEFVIQNSPHHNEFAKSQVEYSAKSQAQQGSSTLQTLLTHG